MNLRFLDLDEWPDERLEEVIRRAAFLERHPVGEGLRGRTVALLFLNPSVRTLASMQAAVLQQGGQCFVVTPGAGSWRMETRDGAVMDGEEAEHIREAIPVLAQYADLLAVRCFARGEDLAEDLADGLIRKMAHLCPKPFVNLESAAAHPCQALGDWKTLEDLEVPRDGRFVLSWAWHPKPLPYAVPSSTLRMALRRGMEVVVLRPEGYELPGPLVQQARDLAARNGARFWETSDRRRAMEGAHVLYAKSWASPGLYGRPAEDLMLRAPLRGEWCVRESWFEGARGEACFMHCLPVRRNVKVADEVLDGPRSVVVRQAGNRLHAQKSLLLEMLGGER